MSNDLDAMLRKAVPATPAPPAVEEIDVRSRRFRRSLALMTIGGLTVAALTVALVASAYLSSGDSTSLKDNASEGWASSLSYTELESALECSENALVQTFEYAPATFPSAEESLDDALRRRAARVEADSFEQASRTSDVIVFRLVDDGRTQAVAASERSEAGWSLSGLVLCAGLGE